jgi:hypothetical protein
VDPFPHKVVVCNSVEARCFPSREWWGASSKLPERVERSHPNMASCFFTLDVNFGQEKKKLEDITKLLGKKKLN